MENRAAGRGVTGGALHKPEVVARGARRVCPIHFVDIAERDFMDPHAWRHDLIECPFGHTTTKWLVMHGGSTVAVGHKDAGRDLERG